jgi:hypothetical protein
MLAYFTQQSPDAPPKPAEVEAELTKVLNGMRQRALLLG